MKAVLWAMALCFSFAAWGGPAVLFEEVEVPGVPKESWAPSKNKGPESEIQPLSQRRTLKSIHQSQEFSSTAELRSKRRVGIGASTAGATGLMGVFLELNLTPANSAITAFGGGPGFGAFNFQWKHVLGGRNFSPYLGVGYARWYNASRSEGGLGRTTPAVLGSKFLTEEQKRSGKFAVDLLNPNIGIQYNNLYGEYTGVGIFAEVDFLAKVPDFSPVPTGSVGVLYYF